MHVHIVPLSLKNVVISFHLIIPAAFVSDEVKMKTVNDFASTAITVQQYYAVCGSTTTDGRLMGGHWDTGDEGMVCSYWGKQHLLVRRSCRSVPPACH